MPIKPQPDDNVTGHRHTAYIHTGRKSRLELRRLRSGLNWSRRMLRPYREERLHAVRQYTGLHFGDNSATDRVPVNMLELGVNTYVSQIAANNPRVMVSTQHPELKPAAYELELATNHLIEEIRLAETLRRAARDAMFSMGIIKVGIEHGGTIEIDGYTHDIGQPFADCIDLDDWVHDMSARRWDQIAYCGNRYRVPYEFLLESGMYDKKVVESIGPTARVGLNTSNEGGDQRVESLSYNTNIEYDQYIQYVECWDVWLPTENKIMTFPVEEVVEEPLRIVEWDGPEHGPYHLLYWHEVPGNLMPLSPAMTWMDLHDFINRGYRKVLRQVERQKTILGVQGGASEDGQRIVNANDGEAIRVDNPEGAREYRFGGGDQHSMSILIQMKNEFSYLAGNLDALAGLGSQAETLGQEKIIKGSASQRMSYMQQIMASFTAGVCRDLAWYMWQDPLIEIPLVKRVSGVEDSEIPVTWTPEQREGDFLDYNFDIDPYSMTFQAPGEKAQQIIQILTQLILPMEPGLQQQGIGVNWEGVLRKLSHFLNLDELEDLLQFTGEPQADRPGPVDTGEAGGGGGEGGRMAPNTTRTYERVNRPGGTRQGRDVAMAQSLMGRPPQGAEQAAVTRPM